MKCARLTCGVEFTPADPRQRYHAYECAQKARDARKRKCPQCHKGSDGFCSAECEAAYGERTRLGRPPRLASVTVLLPAGCNPVRKVTLAVIAETKSYGEMARKIWCARYERCLSHVVSKNWGGFSCAECDVDEPNVNEPRNPKSNWEW